MDIKNRRAKKDSSLKPSTLAHRYMYHLLAMNHYYAWRLAIEVARRHCLNNSARRDAGYVEWILPEGKEEEPSHFFQRLCAKLPRKCNLPRGVDASFAGAKLRKEFQFDKR